MYCGQIESIEEVSDFKVEGELYEGYHIHTHTQDIWLLIGLDRDSHHSFGYFLSQDNFADFIGKDIQDIRLTDINRNSIELSDKYELNEVAGLMFVDLLTEIGILQFTAYNGSNGYYGVAAKIISRDFKVDRFI